MFRSLALVKNPFLCMAMSKVNQFTTVIANRHDENSSGDHEHKSTGIGVLVDAANLKTTTTKAGWCLREGLTHIATVDDGAMLPLIQRHGIPKYLSCCNDQTACRHENATSTVQVKQPSSCFQSLCRTVVGQSVSGFSALAAWKRLLVLTNNNPTPETILVLASVGEDSFQKSVGITRAKAACLVDLARHFITGSLSDDFLMVADEDAVRVALLKVRGIGPWSCDMFLYFYLERPNILPLGDLAVRKGLAMHFDIDVANETQEVVSRRLADYAPFSPLVTYYMYRLLDAPDRKTSAATSKKQKRSDVK